MSRTTRRRAVRAVAPVAGLLAAGLLVWQGSYAAFSATTANAANNWAAGSVSLINDSGAALFTTTTTPPTGATDAKTLKPGDTRINCIKVTNTGSLGGPVKLYIPTGTYSQTNGLGDNLTVTIEEGTGTGTTAYGSCTGFVSTATIVNASTLTALAGASTSYAVGGVGSAGALAPAGVRYYRFTTTVNALAPNTVQSGTATATFQWEIQA
jgi:hypothetical protein